MFHRNGKTAEAHPASLDSAREIVMHARSIVQLELELAKREVREKAATAGAGVGLAATGAFFAVLMIGFLFAAIAAAIALELPVWASILIVAGLLGLLAAGAVLVAVRLLKKATPPIPGRAIREVQKTRDAVSHA